MDSALAASALMMGLAGGPHCVAMCGAAYGGIARQGGSTRPGRVLWALHAGRLASYAVAGALVAASVSALAGLGAAAPVLRPLWTLVHVGGLALGLWLLWAGRSPAWLAVTTRRATGLLDAAPVRFMNRSAPSARAALIGSCWAVMPCGLLQSALIVAALASGPLQGAGVMACFALASAASLALAPWLWQRLCRAKGSPSASRLPVRLAGALLAVACGYALWHGLSAQINQALCAPVAR